MSTEGNLSPTGQRPPSEGEPAPRPPQDTSLVGYLKWSGLMVLVVAVFGFLASRVLRWLDLA